MATDRELISLAKTQTLEAIADQLQRPPAYNSQEGGTVGSFDQAEGEGETIGWLKDE
jgi:hypothetical protein